MILLGLWLEAFVSVLRLKALLFPFMQGRRGGGGTWVNFCWL